MPEIVHAQPTKEFFVRMIVKDISLEDCILDLVDNCLDGANGDIAEAENVRREAGENLALRPGAQGGGELTPNGTQADSTTDKRYEGYWTELTLNEDVFSIRDNCGGISIEEAKNYAFRFGRSTGRACRIRVFYRVIRHRYEESDVQDGKEYRYQVFYRGWGFHCF